MYTFPNTGDVVISSYALVTNLFKYCHGQSTVSFDPGAEARVFILVILQIAEAWALFVHPSHVLMSAYGGFSPLTAFLQLKLFRVHCGYADTSV